MILNFGNPPQKIIGIFDTGSSDLIIPQAGSAVCLVPNQQCRGSNVVLGDFDASKDTNFQPRSNSGFNAAFGAGGTLSGSYIMTTVSIGNAALGGVQVGLAVNGSMPRDAFHVSRFGVGPVDSEQTQEANKYANLPQHMKDVGLISANMVSLSFNSTPFANGSATFGGIDQTKFQGKLEQVSIEADDKGKMSRFVVKMTSINLSIGGAGRRRSIHLGKRATTNLGLGQSNGFTAIDTSAPFIAIPNDSIANLAKALGTSFSDQSGLGLIDCALASGDNSLIFGFNNDSTLISVPLSRIVISKDVLTKEDQQSGRCALSIAAAGPKDALNVMGYPFMTAVYTVFDMDNKRLLFAKAV
ncbi:hypothetical protein QQS21_010428 [Conoideocrella luteorostrata]|uniref:Peptidase A1 domain-containing protein n=1 Tax=Conoideocrella luteorostrata TaxID=1105319 RepID=A0AAJ0CJH6_9HYPO|nr:hypothetical protein QQS21_010428 [Conoideocrella luteorostrata]